MSNKSSKYTTITIIILALLLLIACGAYYQNYKQNQSNLDGLKSFYNQKVTLYKDDNGRLIAEVEQAKIDKASAEIVLKGRFDSLAKEFKVKARDITEHQRITITTQATNLKPKIIHDTIIIEGEKQPYIKFKYKDDFLGIVGYSANDDVWFDTVQTFHNIDIIHSEKFKHWYSLNSTEHISVKDDNIYTVNLGLKSVEIYRKPKRIVISSGVGLGVNSNGLGWSVNLIQVGYKWLEF